MKLVIGAALAVALTAQAQQVKNTSAMDFGSGERFGSFEENYALLANWMRNNGWAGHDERAMRAHYSLRYSFFGRSADQCGADTLVCTTYEAFLAYTGEFDFYLNTRPSGPVINRLSNPGLHLRWRPKALFPGNHDGDYLSASYEHASDGQVTEVSSAADAAVAQRNYDERHRPYFDQISRGSNFFSLGARVSTTEGIFPLTVAARLRAYTSQDSDVTWGPLAGRGVRLSDYHRVSATVEQATRDFGRFELRWTVGDKGLATDSFDLGWQYKLTWPKGLALPLYLRLHHGPLNTLSNYTQRQDSIGIGLRFADF